jgi:hypothetical protein
VLQNGIIIENSILNGALLNMVFTGRNVGTLAEPSRRGDSALAQPAGTPLYNAIIGQTIPAG